MPKQATLFWNYFTKKGECAICKKCGASLKMSQASTSSARYHLRTKHPLTYSELTKLEAAVVVKKTEEAKEVAEANKVMDAAYGKFSLLIFIFFG